MGYNVKTIFPKDEQMDDENQKYITTRRTEVSANKNLTEVIEMYNQYQLSDYKVNVSFHPGQAASEDNEEVSPFDVAQQLTASGIDYKATLKVNNSKGSYDDMLELAHRIESHGYDFNVDIKLKVNDESPVNIEHETTWMGEDAVYKVTPKASSLDIEELHGIYDDLKEQGYDVDIDIKPKKKSGEDDDFDTQLAAYPDGTEVVMSLQDLAL